VIIKLDFLHSKSYIYRYNYNFWRRKYVESWTGENYQKRPNNFQPKIIPGVKKILGANKNRLAGSGLSVEYLV
jgi:hypothetical protein